jgi:hypothetical protein
MSEDQSRTLLSYVRDEDLLSLVVGEIKVLQLLLRKRDEVSFLGEECPAFVFTCWLYLVDILGFLLAHWTQTNSYLLIQRTQNPSFWRIS